VNPGQIVRDFALAMETADHRRPQAASHRDAARLYQPGIGPFGEDAAVAMTVAEMQSANRTAYANVGKRRYPDGSHICDLALGPRRGGLIRLPAPAAEGQVVWTYRLPPGTGRRLVSFLVSYMFVYLRLSPSIGRL
jgi:hypothetical protein